MSGTMSVRRLALGTLLVGFEGTHGTGVPYWLLDMLGNGVAGVTIFGRNITASDPVGGLAGLARGLRHGRPDLLVAIDEEGGDVTRLDTETGSMFLGQSSLGAVDDVNVTRRSSASLAARLASAGVNLNFAPVADVASNAASPIVGSRSFSADPVRVARHVAAAVRGHLDSGVAATAKHFPGHGATADDSHLVVPTVDVDLATLRKRELPPFAAAVDAGVPVVMTGHLLVPSLDPDAPATMSPRIIDGLLRTEMGFEGVVVTDGLDMHAITGTVGRPEAVVRALLAGVDLMCIGGDSVTAEVVEDIVVAVEEAVAKGRLPRARLVQAAGRVSALAERFAHDSSTRGRVSDPPMLEEARASLRVVGDPFVGKASTVVELRNEPSIVAGEVAFGMGQPLRAISESVRVVQLERDAPLPELGEGDVVVSVRDCHLHPWQVEAVAALRRAHPDLVVVDHGGSAPPEVLGDR
ncbi:MAG: glycoside hydrolase family 3 N-terminal domain-containing protein, partial [Propionibacteriaceae bacterium]|nr:glycoside hydrolase family 3 N-terminal domain-containing protein [Propionibacteriaceae bacterium]